VSLLDEFHIQGRVLDPSVESYYPNITGYVHGDVAFTNITTWKDHASQLMKDVNITGIESRLGSWDWNTTNKISLSVMEKPPPDSDVFDWTSLSFIHVRLSLIMVSLHLPILIRGE
jgi:hypothetical protein